LLDSVAHNDTTDESKSIWIPLTEYCDSIDDFEQRVEEELPPLRLLLVNRTLFAREMPGPVHESISRRIGYMIMNTCPNVDNIGSTTLRTTQGEGQPDEAILPWTRPIPVMGAANPKGIAFPTVVVEVGISERLSDLDNLAAHWFSARTDIQVYLCVRIWARRQDNTFQAVVMKYQRGAVNPLIPDTIISFGTGRLSTPTANWCNNQINFPAITGYLQANNINSLPALGAANSPGYIIQIPAASIYHAVPTGVPIGVPVNVPLCLYQLQQAISRVI